MKYRMPAEFETQERVWFAWPHRKQDWPGKFAPIPYVFAEMLRVISQHQRVGLIVKKLLLPVTPPRVSRPQLDKGETIPLPRALDSSLTAASGTKAVVHRSPRRTLSCVSKRTS